mmetsp:Transcript_45/g.153  ORF Transcript_45/g.153 Transcript_45/m.153 type:complete len:238 (-) Transcript_45:297-1010(-)
MPACAQAPPHPPQASVFEAQQAAESALQAVGDSMHLLGWERRNQGSAALAVPLYAAALAVYEAVLGPGHPQAASTLVNLGNAFFDLGRHPEAAALYRRSLAIDEEVLGTEHPDVAMDLSNLGIVYRNLGHLPQARRLFLRARRLLAQALGEDHPSTHTVDRNLSKLGPAAGAGPGDEGGDSLTPRMLAQEVTGTLDSAPPGFAEEEATVGAMLLRAHVDAAREAAEAARAAACGEEG